MTARATAPPRTRMASQHPAHAGPPDAPGRDRYEEFLRLFARDRERLYAYIFALLPHHADAEDVFQRCSVLLWRKFAEFDAERRFLAWACGIASLEVCNFLRVAGRDRLRLDPELVDRLAERRLESLEEDDPDERLELLRDCLGRLKGPERELVQLAYAGEVPLKELAGRSGRAAQTFYNQLSQIRRKLFRCMQRSLAAGG